MFTAINTYTSQSLFHLLPVQYLLISHIHIHLALTSYPIFLDGHICKVNKHVVKFIKTGIVLYCAKPTES